MPYVWSAKNPLGIVGGESDEGEEERGRRRRGRKDTGGVGVGISFF